MYAELQKPIVFAWDLLLGNFRLESVAGNARLETVAWNSSLGNGRLESVASELSLGNCHSTISFVDLVLGTLRWKTFECYLSLRIYRVITLLEVFRL